MWGWIALGVVVVALVVLAVVALGTAGRLRPLHEAMTRLTQRQREVEETEQAIAGMQTNLDHLRQRAETTKLRLAETKRRAAAIRPRGDHH